MDISEIVDDLIELPAGQVDEFLDDIVRGIEQGAAILGGSHANPYPSSPPIDFYRPQTFPQPTDPARTTYGAENARGATGTGAYKGRGTLGGAWANHQTDMEIQKDRGREFRPLTGGLQKYEHPTSRLRTREVTPQGQAPKYSASGTMHMTPRYYETTPGGIVMKRVTPNTDSKTSPSGVDTGGDSDVYTKPRSDMTLKDWADIGARNKGLK